MKLDLNTVFDAGLKVIFEENRRGDEHLAHVSHLGKCLYQTLLSRERAPEIKREGKDLQFLLKGLHDEAYIVDVLKAGLRAQYAAEGWNVLTGVVISDEDFELAGHLDIELARRDCRDCCSWLMREAPVGNAPARWVCASGNGTSCMSFAEDELHGIERRLIEIKTTQWRELWVDMGELGKPNKKGERKPIKTRVAPGPYPEPYTEHRFQAIGYCRRRPLNPDGKHMPYSVFQWDRALNGWHQYPAPGEWYDSDDEEWLELHDAWTWKIVELTAPGSDPVANGIATEAGDGRLAGRPPNDKACTYCPFVQCALNRNPKNPGFAPPILTDIQEDVFA